jgi:hypothetical protein
MVEQNQDDERYADEYHSAPITPAPLQMISLCVQQGDELAASKATHSVSMCDSNARCDWTNNDVASQKLAYNPPMSNVDTVCWGGVTYK